MILKFRAWDKTNKKMMYEGFDIAPDGNLWANAFSLTDQVIVMQAIGYKDIDRKDIFMGDILSNGIETLVMNDGGIIPHDKVKHFRVFGNVWENPDLLPIFEPKIHSHIEDSLYKDHKLAYAAVYCDVCKESLHASNNECMQIWVETGSGNYCFEHFAELVEDGQIDVRYGLNE